MSTHRKFAASSLAALIGASLLVAAAAAPASAATKSYTLAAVKAHKSASNCWTAVNGKVYNLTKWISKHPGGSSVIKAMCGKDATSAFKAQHGLSGRPASTLAAYRIGTLTRATPSATATPTATAGATLNAALVAKHNTANDCWSIVNGNVYNFTTWIPAHRGGSGVIIALCGIDGTSAFKGQHGNQREPNSTLGRFLLGAVGTPAP